jgi:hypothetical protein
VPVHSRAAEALDAYLSVALKRLLLHLFPAQSTGGVGQAGALAGTAFDAGVEAGAWAPAKAGTRIANDSPQRNRRDRCEDSLGMNLSS